MQTLQYADACERAGTFEPCQVIAALEGHRFDGMGNGVSEYRASDHQCLKDVTVVRGKSAPTGRFDLFDVVGTVPRATVTFADDDPPFAGDLGPFRSGADGVDAGASNASSGSPGGGGGAIGLASVAIGLAALIARSR